MAGYSKSQIAQISDLSDKVLCICMFSIREVEYIDSVQLLPNLH